MSCGSLGPKTRYPKLTPARPQFVHLQDTRKSRVHKRIIDVNKRKRTQSLNYFRYYYWLYADYFSQVIVSIMKMTVYKLDSIH